MRAAPFAVAVLTLLPVGPALAADAPAAAAKKVRAALPAPAEGAGFEFEGDRVLDGDLVGTVRYVVDSGVYRDKPVWLVTETRHDLGGTERFVEVSSYLAQDLSLIRGESETKVGETTVRLSFVRTEEGFDVTRGGRGPQGDLPGVKVRAKAPPDATFGRAAVLLFLRGAPKGPATYTMPVFFPEIAAAAGSNEHDVAGAVLDGVVEVKGPSTYGGKPAPAETWLGTFRTERVGYDVHLAAADRSLVAVAGVAPEPDVVPKGTAPKKPENEDDKPAATWKAAFMKFGHGYHMAVPKYLEASFHWPSFYAHEVQTKSWTRGEGVSAEDDFRQFKEQWVKEFLSRSLRRPRADADALLHGTLATGTATKKGDDEVVFAAHAEYGGGVQRTYHLKRIEGVWYIVRIDW
jgi:hypothetical protein